MENVESTYIFRSVKELINGGNHLYNLASTNDTDCESAVRHMIREAFGGEI